MNWILHPFSGIESEEGIKISFGIPRAALRKALASHFQPLKQNKQFLDEDDFISPDGLTFIRVRYDENDAVRDIEFLEGTLRYQGANLHAHTTLEEVRQFLGTQGMSLRPSQWLGDGWDCVELGLNVASHEDVGGAGDEMEWVILSTFHRFATHP
jgi:hypothetical protein